ncbi:TetR/AcrR family transcriptional regulator [Frankia sp. R82]|uniref:TetR/AcrR family transcriptional regulator n=1 Tax=Frankia sp. R82 TaxID=2950553 RepID=UPI002043446C|nr:TetR/AcrR family transcriptional regulator [Frankia sp. R82]MCM3885523.1 TetR/AcrR family transcriptional regulator [Frankia sp. R82]
MARPAASERPGHPRRTGGRIRSQDAHDDVLRAAVEILEEVGYGGVTIEGVAARSGVAKSTIYRWWTSKAALVMDAYGKIVAGRMPRPDTGTVADDLTDFVAELYRVADYPLRGKALRGLMAEAQLDPAFEESFRSWVQSRRDVVAGLLIRGIDRGELDADLDLDHAVDLVFGPFWYRLLVGHVALDAAQARGHVDRLLQGLRHPPEQ